MTRRAGWLGLVGLLVGMLLLPMTGWGQGPGLFVAVPGTGRPTCAAISGPVTDASWCFDGANGVLNYWNGVAWTSITAGGTAPGDATYLTQIPNATLTNEQAMSLLGTGLVVNTTATGVQSIYGGASCPGGQALASLTAGGGAGCIPVGGVTPGSALSGVVVISDIATTGSVVFGVAQADDTYVVTGWTRGLAGTPPRVTSDYFNKTVAGFDVEISAAPGAGNSVEVNWHLNRAGTGGPLSGSGVAGQVTFWTGVTTLGGDPALLFGQDVLPVGNALSTRSTIAAQATTTATDIRQFTGIFGLTSNQGAAHTGANKDKVALYAGTDALAGTGDVWSINSVLTQNAGSGSYNAQGYELDFNNFVGHRGETDAGPGLAAPVSYGHTITGAGIFRSTAALGIYGNGFFGDGLIASLTRSGGTATVTTTNPHTFPNGSDVTITGALQPEYNGSHTIAVTGGSTFTYTVGGAPATPATTGSFLLASMPLWNRGIVFALNAISYTGSTIQDLGNPGKVLDIRGHPIYGIYQDQPDVQNRLTGGATLGPSTIATLPAAGTLGRVIYTTDDSSLKCDDGATWAVCNATAASGLTGSGADTRITVWSGAATLTGFTDFLWDNANGNLDAGGNTLAGAGSAFAIGYSNTLSGGSMVALGFDNVADTGFVYMMGADNDLSGTLDAGAWGEFNVVSGFDAWAFGEQNTLSGNDSSAHGERLDDDGNSDAHLFGEAIVADRTTAAFLGVAADPLAGIIVEDGTVTLPGMLVASAPTNGGSANITLLTEDLTILAAGFTDTAIQAPPNSLILGVTVRVTTAIPATTTTFSVGVAGSTTRYGTGIPSGLGNTNASPGTTNPTIYTSATSVRITPNVAPGAATGTVRVTIHYLDLTPPSS